MKMKSLNFLVIFFILVTGEHNVSYSLRQLDLSAISTLTSLEDILAADDDVFKNLRTLELTLALYNVEFRDDVFINLEMESPYGSLACNGTDEAPVISDCSIGDLEDCYGGRGKGIALEDVETSKLVSFTVENYDTCGAVVISTGGVGLLVQDPDTGIVIFNSGEDPFFGSSRLFKMCCQDIRDMVPAWNGTLYVTLYDLLSSSSIPFHFFGVPHTQIPLSDMYTLANPRILCADEEYFWSPLTVTLDTLDLQTTALLNYPPYFDSFALSRLSNDPFDYTNNIINFALVVEASETITSTLSTSKFWRNFRYNECRFELMNVVYANGDNVEMTENPSKLDLSALCNYTKFTEIGQLVQDVISSDDILSSEEGATIPALISRTESAEYLSCKHLIENTLSTTFLDVRNDHNCSFNSFYNPDFYDDYCCRGTGEHPGEKCESRQYEEPLRVVDEIAVSESECTSLYISSYLNITQPATTLNDCDELFYESLGDFQGNVLEDCYKKVYSLSCISSEQCVENFGRSSLCFQGHCEKFCSRDSDCFPTTCDLDGPNPFCRTHGNGYPQTVKETFTAHKTSEGESLTLKCVVTELSKNNLIADYLQLLNEEGASTSTFEDILAIFEDYFITKPICTGKYWLAHEFAEQGTVTLEYDNQLRNFERPQTFARPTTKEECEVTTCNWIPIREVTDDFNLYDCQNSTQFCGDRFYPFLDAYPDITAQKFCFINDLNSTTCTGEWIEDFRVYTLYNQTEAFCIANDTQYCNYGFPGFTFGNCFLETCESRITGFGQFGNESLCPSPLYRNEVECTAVGGNWSGGTHLVSSGYEESCPHANTGYCFGRPLNYPAVFPSGCQPMCVGSESFRPLPFEGNIGTGISFTDCNTLGECYSFFTNIFSSRTESELETLTGVCTKPVSWDTDTITIEDQCGSADDWTIDPTRLHCVSYSKSLRGQAACEAESLTWIPVPATQEECLEIKACFQLINNIPTILALREDQCFCFECSWDSVYTWSRSYFVNVFYSKVSTWNERGPTEDSNQWVQVIDEDLFDGISAAATFSGLIRKQRSNFACKFNELHTYATQILCQINDSCLEDNSFVVPPISYQEICLFDVEDQYIAEKFTKGTFLLTNATTFSELDNRVPCTSIAVRSLSFISLNTIDLIPIQTVDLSPRIQRLRNRPTTILNRNGVVLGQIIDDLYVLESSATISGEFSFCFPDDTWSEEFLDGVWNTPEFKSEIRKTVSVSPYVDLVEGGEISFEWEILDAVNFGQLRCGTVTSDISGPLVFARSWTFYNQKRLERTEERGVIPARSYFDNMSVFARILDIVMVMLYMVAFLLCGINFWLHIKFHDRRNRVFWTLPKLGLLFLLSFQTIRIVYHIIVLFPVLQNAPLLTFFFSEFAALIYYSVCAITVLRWAEIYHFAMSSKGTLDKVMPLYIGINVLLALCFVVVFIIYAALAPNASEKLGCDGLNPTPEFATLTGVAVFYKIYFSVICLGLVVAFILYTFGLRSRLTSSKKVSKKQNRNAKKLQKLVIVSAITILSLVAQVINLITTIFWNTRDLWVSLIFSFITELIPMFIFLYMFRRKSQFSKQGNVTAATGSATQTR